MRQETYNIEINVVVDIPDNATEHDVEEYLAGMFCFQPFNIDIPVYEMGGFKIFDFYIEKK